ncbi:MAG: Dipeptide permease [Planctomycetota bacterium]|jgi:POT family proton-dependent oligopeptide transporter
MSTLTANTDSPQTEQTVFGHSPGLFLLFFTEMWERFSYYGMRALLVLFLVSDAAAGGWAWTRAEAMELYGWYTGLVYVTPILGGILADAILGYRRAVLLGALLMTLGHGAMAFETRSMFYAGLVLLIIGNGLFKPNISSIVGQLYKNKPEKKDSAYTIFYMGINAGAFFGMLFCGYIGEKISWSYGFGLAGIFMFLGMLMFQFGQTIFGELGLAPTSKDKPKQPSEQQQVPQKVETDRLLVIGILSFFTIFFWMAFEQAGGSMNIFAKDYTARVLKGTAATAFFWVDTLLTLVPLVIVTWVLFKLVAATRGKIALSNAFIVFSFVIIWSAAVWRMNREFNTRAYELAVTPLPAAAAPASTDKPADSASEESAAAAEKPAKPAGPVTASLLTDVTLEAGQEVIVVDLAGKGGEGTLRLLSESEAANYSSRQQAVVKRILGNETEVTASWFQTLNSFFIIALAPLIGRIWETRLNPSAPVKFGLGLILLGVGFAALGMACVGLEKGAKTAQLSMWWLVVAYLFHTLGELFVSPVGLSYVSKLAPARLVGLMFGIWFLASAIANYLAGLSGAMIDKISEQYGLATFFFVFTAVPAIAGFVLIAGSREIRRRMHGIE